MTRSIHVHGFTTDAEGNQHYEDDHAKADGFTVYVRTATPESEHPFEVSHETDFSDPASAEVFALTLQRSVSFWGAEINHD